MTSYNRGRELEIMGDIYEYLLGKIAAAGENGQFRTPRHIINMIVELMKPTLKDLILDPAMGSAGFLLASASYVSAHQKKELMNMFLISMLFRLLVN